MLGEYLRQIGTFSRNARLLLAGYLLVNTGVGVFGVLFNLYLQGEGKSLAFLGTLSAANTMAAAAGSLLSPVLLRRYDARWVMVAGVAAFGLALLGQVYLPADAALLALTSVAGASIALAMAPASPYLAEHSTPSERTHLFSIFFAVLTGGVTLGSLLSGLLPLLLTAGSPAAGLAATRTDRLALTVAALLILLGGLPFSRLAPGRLGARLAHVPEVSVPPRACPTCDLAAMLASVAVLACAFGLVFPFFTLFLADAVHASAGQISVLFTVSSIVTTVATLASPALSRGLGKLPAFTLLYALSAGCLLAFAAKPAVLVAAAAYVVWSSLLNIGGAIDDTFVMELLPARRRQAAASLRVATYNLGWALTSFGAGHLIQTWGFTPAFLLAALGTLGGAALYGGYFHTTGHREARDWFLARPPWQSSR